MHDDITLCLTMGKRPDLLKQTLESLFAHHTFQHVIAINDFGDEATNEAFKTVCPHGILINLGHQVGHHAAVDALYAGITTPYVFHCEDDWYFYSAPDLEASKVLLERPDVSSVCYRALSDFRFEANAHAKIQHCTHTTASQNIPYASLHNLHDQWHGYTFNPHLAKLDTWHHAVTFTKFKKERHISRWQRSLGRNVAFISPGNCHHIGDDASVANPSQPNSIGAHLKRWKKQIKSWLRPSR